MEKFMNRLPTVISCCFCCFLRAGTVMIALFSFCVGLVFAPNVSHAKGFWDMESVLSNYSYVTEMAVQMTLGVVSIMLCVVSMLLMVGAFCPMWGFVALTQAITDWNNCNLPSLILIYLWGTIIYSGTTVLLFLILAAFCFFVHTNCIAAGGLLCILVIFNILFTAYFVIVANSLRVSLKFLTSEEYRNVA